MQHNPQPKPWHKTVGGITFLIILFTVIAIFVFFGGLITYYSWQVKYGDARKLDQEFNPRFTVQKSLTGKSTALAENLNMADFIRPHNPVSGNADAPVQIIAFVDVECPFTREGWPALYQMIQIYEPVVRVVFKNLSLKSGNSQLAIAPSCVQQQWNLLEYMNRLFEETNFSPDALVAYAQNSLLGEGYPKDVKLDEDLFRQCLDKKTNQSLLQDDLKDAISLGVRGTPTFIVNNKKIEGALSKEEWDEIILGEMEK